MNKSTIRILFNGDHAEKHAAWFYENIKLSAFYRSYELDPEREDAVTFEVSPLDPLTSLQYLFALLDQVHSYMFVGPKCPKINEAAHPRDKRFMLETGMFGVDEFTCFGCRTKMPLTFGENFFDQKSARMLMMMEMLRIVRPMPHPKDKILGPPQSGVTITGRTITDRRFTARTSYSEPSHRFSKKDRDKMSKDLLDVDYATLEFATLFHTLGMKHTIDVQALSNLQYGTEGADWLDQGGGAVLLISPDDNNSHARNVISSWMKKNQTSERFCLALVEVDKQNLNSDLFNKEAVQKAAKEFTAVRTNRAAEKMLKKSDYSMTPETLRRVSNIDMDGARLLIEAWFKQWPEIKRYHDGQQITMLTAENDRLREDLDNAEEAKKVLHADLNKLKKELHESDEALSDSNTKLDEKPSDRPLVKAADDLLRFLAGVNMQDHATQEQREFNSKFSALKKALLDLGVGNEPLEPRLPPCRS